MKNEKKKAIQMKKILLFILSGLFLSLSTQMMANGLPNSFLDESNGFDPELLLMEPHYTPDGKIEYYALANIVKITYDYNTAGQAIRKNIWYFDKHSNDWQLLIVSQYEYKDGRLVKETLDNVKLSKQYTYHIENNISYDPISRTDTIRSTSEISSAYPHTPNHHEKGTYTIRFYNQKENRIDSTLQVSTFHNHYSSTEGDHIVKKKVVYRYDSKGRIASSNTYHQFYDAHQKTTSPWEELHALEVRYDENQTEYVQKSLYEKRSELEPENETIRFVVTYDKMNRLTGKKLTIGDEVVLNARYTYDTKGRTHAYHEQNMTEKFERLAGSFGIGAELLRGIGTESKYMKYTLDLQDDCELSSFYTKKDGTESKIAELSFCKQPDGQTTEINRKQFKDGKLDEYEKVTLSYRTDGMVEKTEYWCYPDTKETEPRKKSIIGKDANENITYEEIYRFDERKKQWNPKDKNLYAYNKDGYQTHEERYQYETIYSYMGFKNPENKTEDWIGKEWTENKYDARNNIIETQEKSWDGVNWNNKHLVRNAYNECGEKTLEERYDWNEKMQYWKGLKRDSILYNDTCQTNGSIYYKWLDTERTWIPVQKGMFEEMTYDLRKEKDRQYYFESKKTDYDWVVDKWIPSSKKEEKKGNQNYFYCIWRWDQDSSAWYAVRRNVDQQTGDVSSSEYATWDDDLNALTGREKTTTVKLESGNNDKKIIHAVWDHKNKEWKDSIAICCIFGKNGVTASYEYEFYNDKTKSWEYARKVVVRESNSDEINWSTVKEQSVWDNKQNTWMPQTRLTLFYCESADRAHQSETFTYNSLTKSWIPAYRYELTVLDKNKDQRIRLYSAWNTQEEKWLPLYAAEDSDWPFDYYKWDANEGKLAPASYSEIGSKITEISKAYSATQHETNYSDLIKNE